MRWFYLKDENKFPVACVASDKEENMIVFSVSTHNPVDPFDRDVARQVAIGRLTAKKFAGVVTDETGIKEKIVTKIAASKTLPARAIEAANYWLSQRKTA